MGHRGARVMAARVVDLWRDRPGVSDGDARRLPGQPRAASMGERGRAAACNRGEGGAVPVAMARIDPAFRALVLQRREWWIECWLGVSDYGAANVSVGRSQTESRDSEPLCADRAG